MKPKITAPEGRAEIIVSHTFDAPAEAVFKAWTDPMLIPKWWGPARLSTMVDRMEAFAGGSWRFVQRDPNGHVHAFHGVYHAVEVPRRIVSTFEYEGTPGHVLLETTTFEAAGAKTLYTGLSVFQALGDRDAMWAAGCEAGMAETIARMDELLHQGN